MTNFMRGVAASVATITDDADALRLFCASVVSEPAFVAAFLTALADSVHQDNVEAGWWTNMETGESTLHTRNVPEMLCLIHSEISEAMEGYRKNLADDKLPHRAMFHVELVDAMVRILDLAGSRQSIHGVEIGTIFEEKREINRSRDDHKLAARRAAGGKAF